MAIFRISLEKTLEHEGGYANLGADTIDTSDDDTGGETIFGISRNNHPNSILWKEIDNYKEMLKPFNKSKYKQINELAKNNSIIMNEVERIYKESYWNKIKGNDIKIQENADVLFDMAVNAGHSRAIKLAQEVCSIKVDGICGNITINSINTLGKDFCNWYVDKRISWYKTRKNQTYVKAWVNRAERFRIK